MNDNWKFSGLPYTSPDVEALQARYDALTQRAKDAQDPEDLLEVVRQRDALQQEVALCQSIATIRAFHDVTDEFYQRELQETLPRLETLDTQSLSMTIADSPYAAAVDEAFGPQLRRLLTLDQRLHTGGKELQARISRLTAQYQQLAASTKYQVQGETLSGGQLRFALTSTHRERRKAAYDAQQQTAVENGPVMEKLLRELVHARNQLARENGFDSFADYGDLSMQRLGYGRAELDEFCRQVQKYITPLYLQMQEQQRQRLGVETLLPYDRALVFPEGNAVPVAAEELPKAAHRMYHALRDISSTRWSATTCWTWQALPIKSPAWASAICWAPPAGCPSSSPTATAPAPTSPSIPMSWATAFRATSPTAASRWRTMWG